MSRLTSLILVIFALAELIRKGKGQDFGYDGTEGPDFWGTKFQQCVGKHQSPINIDEHKVETVDLLPIKYENFEEDGHLSLLNNGHTVQFKFKSDKIPTISGGPLIGNYLFAQFHFHWGATDDEGSENRINNSSFPMELHVVFYSASYGSFQAATEHPDGLCVVAFLYSKAEKTNDKYTEIIKALPKISKVGSNEEISEPIALDHLLSSEKSHYFTYGGSLTTPPCLEVVTWIEFKHTIPLTHEQMESFRQLNSVRGKLTSNFRPPQKLYGRVIRTNRDVRCSGSYNSNNLFVLTISVIVLCALRLV